MDRLLNNPSTNYSGVESLIKEMLVSNMLNIEHLGMDVMCLCWPLCGMEINTLQYLHYFSILVPLVYSAVFVVNKQYTEITISVEKYIKNISAVFILGFQSVLN